MEPVIPKLDDAKRVVVKIGSALLVDREAGGVLRRDWLAALIEDVAEIKRRGTDVVLVSSGSIALGRGILNLGNGPLPLERAQAAAAVGQIQLARAYDEELRVYGLSAAQILVTLADSADRRRYLNARATLGTLLRLGAIPIVNENDTVATDEIRFGDNDRLAAQIAVTVAADRLVLCSDVDGLYTANPQKDPNARHLPLIDTISPEIEAMAGGAASHLSKGGMKTKIIAARTANAAGCDMAIVDGAELHPLRRLREGARATWFTAQTDPQTARKAWIAATKAQGAVRVDTGATDALLAGRSLLPAGITEVIGAFDRGDPISIEDQGGHVLGYGLARYTSEEATAIAGKKTGEIADILGYEGRRVIVHRDDLALLDKT